MSKLRFDNCPKILDWVQVRTIARPIENLEVLLTQIIATNFGSMTRGFVLQKKYHGCLRTILAFVDELVLEVLEDIGVDPCCLPQYEDIRHHDD